MGMIQPTVFIAEDEVAFFRDKGYLVIEAMTSPEEVEELREIYDRLFAARAGRAEGNQYDLAGTDAEDQPAKLPQIINPVSYAPELRETQFRVNAAQVARRLLGSDVEFQGEHAIMKPPAIGEAAPWHQDESYWKEELEYDGLSVWLALQETTVENGCMQFIPGSHKGDVLPHHSIGHDPRIHGLEVDDVMDASTAVACTIPAGGATIHHCRTLHYTGPNQTDTTRRAYIHTWAAPYKSRSQPRDFYWQRMRQTARDERRLKSGTVSVSSGRAPDS